MGTEADDFKKGGACCVAKPAQKCAAAGKACADAGEVVKADASCAAAACTDDEFKKGATCCMAKPNQSCAAGAGAGKTCPAATSFLKTDAAKTLCAAATCTDDEFKKAGSCCSDKQTCAAGIAARKAEIAKASAAKEAAKKDAA